MSATHTNPTPDPGKGRKSKGKAPLGPVLPVVIQYRDKATGKTVRGEFLPPRITRHGKAPREATPPEVRSLLPPGHDFR